MAGPKRERKKLRGAAKGPQQVKYEDWGKEISLRTVYSRNGKTIYEEDETRWAYEPAPRKTTKAYMLDLVNAWKNDDGTYGTGDEAIYIAYDDGRFLDLTDGDAHGRWSKRGITGISVSTGDDEAVWGGERNRRTGVVEPWETNLMGWSEKESFYETGETASNTHMMFKGTAVKRVRVRTTYEEGQKRPKREIVRESTWKKLDRPI